MAGAPLLRPDFWEILRPALQPARAAGLAYLDSPRYASVTDERKYDESNEGWPLVVTSDIFAKGPPDWRQMFSTKPGRFAQVVVEDVPELAASMRAAIELAEDDHEFGQRLSYLHEPGDAERRRFAELEFTFIVGDILGRAEALGIEDEEGLRDLYRQIERGRFSDELEGDVLVPLVLTTFEAEQPVHLMDTFWLEPLSEEMHRARALSRSESAVSPLIAAAATHAVVQRDAKFPNVMYPPSFRRGQEPVPVPLETVHRVLECIHIVTGKKSGYAQVAVRSDRWVSWSGWVGDLPHVWRAAAIRAYPDDFEFGWLQPKEPISDAELTEIAAATKTLSASPKNVKLAARRCYRSTFRADIEDEILDATIGIEALLSADRDELTHRMSQRAAAALADEFRAEAIYDILKQLYGQRSTIVHGATPKNSIVQVGDSQMGTNHIGVFLLRVLLRNYLNAEKPWTPTSLDAMILRRIGREEDEAQE